MRACVCVDSFESSITSSVIGEDLLISKPVKGRGLTENWFVARLLYEGENKELEGLQNRFDSM